MTDSAVKPPANWTPHHTGGGCMAWRRELGERYALITSDDGGYMPDASDIESDSIFCGVYDATTGDPVAECEGPLSLAAAIAFAESHNL